ncbi:hypothetical protein HpSLK36_07020 [Helicobacter pylori]
MAFFNIFKMNFLKFYYYRIINPNKGTDFTPTTQQENFFKACGIKRAFKHSNPIKSPLQGHRARTKPHQL